MKSWISLIIVSSVLAVSAASAPAAAPKPPAKPKTAPLTIKQPKKAAPTTQDFTGPVDKVDVKTGNLTLKEQDFVRVFICGKETKLTGADGKTPVALKDLKVGDQVKVQYYLNDFSESVCTMLTVVPPAKKPVAKPAEQATNTVSTVKPAPKKPAAKKH